VFLTTGGLISDGQYFDAKDLNLIRLYDDDATLREEIRHRLATYRLHRNLPPAPEGDLEGHETIREGGRQRCSACDHLIPGSDTEPMELRYPGGIEYLHARCYSSGLKKRADAAELPALAGALRAAGRTDFRPEPIDGMMAPR
jgi:hypothetical protein